MAKPSPFKPALFRFLAELEANNNRAWFDANKARYESEVREPALEFIRAFAPHLKKISPYMVAIDRKAGGSLMRVYRDTRFSKSKLPYKTNVGIQFRHIDGKDVHAPGLYLHLDNSQVFMGAGMWHPESDALRGMRESIAEKPAEWKRVRDAKAFREVWRLDGDSLKRPPRGYDADHPMIEDLKRKDHIAVTELSRGEVTRAGFVEKVAERFRKSKRYMTFQAAALGISF